GAPRGRARRRRPGARRGLRHSGGAGRARRLAPRRRGGSWPARVRLPLVRVRHRLAARAARGRRSGWRHLGARAAAGDHVRRSRRSGHRGCRHMSTTNPPVPDLQLDPRAFRHLADAQVNVELDTGDMVLNIGPQHPATHGTLRIVVRLDGERVLSADPIIGYMHRGYEKLAEFRTYPQITTLINRIDWLSSFANEVPFIDGAEQLMGIQAPPRAQYIRTIL